LRHAQRRWWRTYAAPTGDYKDECDATDQRDAIPTARRRRQAATELERFDLGTMDMDGYEGDDGDDQNVDGDEEPLQADDGSTQIVENWGHSPRKCEDWTVYFRPVK